MIVATCTSLPQVTFHSTNEAASHCHACRRACSRYQSFCQNLPSPRALIAVSRVALFSMASCATRHPPVGALLVTSTPNGFLEQGPSRSQLTTFFVSRKMRLIFDTHAANTFWDWPKSRNRSACRPSMTAFDGRSDPTLTAHLISGFGLSLWDGHEPSGPSKMPWSMSWTMLWDGTCSLTRRQSPLLGFVLPDGSHGPPTSRKFWRVPLGFRSAACGQVRRSTLQISRVLGRHVALRTSP